MKKQLDIQTLKGIGEFNAWKGNILLYLTKKEVRSLKDYGINENMTIKEAYEALISQ